MQEKRKKLLFFNCNEAFTLGYACKELFWLEFKGKKSREPREWWKRKKNLRYLPVQSRLLLRPLTMKIQALVASPIFILVYSGSTCCFIGEAMLKQSSLVMESQ